MLSPFERDLQLAQVDLVARHRGEQLVGLGEAELRRERLEAGVRRAFAAQLLLDHRAAGGDGLGERLGVEPLADLVARAGALDEAALGVEPVARRAAGLGGDDLDALAAGERRVERHDVAVDPRAAAAVAEVGVQRVGEVDRRRARRQVDHPALRREHVDGVVDLRACSIGTSSRHASSWRSQAIFCSNAFDALAFSL